MTDAARFMPCSICDNTGWVCETHGNHPWSGVSSRSDSCDDGPGMPCPSAECEFSLSRQDREAKGLDEIEILVTERSRLIDRIDERDAEIARLRAALEAIASECLAALRASGGNYYIHAFRHMALTALAAQHTGDKHE